MPSAAETFTNTIFPCSGSVVGTILSKIYKSYVSSLPTADNWLVLYKSTHGIFVTAFSRNILSSVTSSTFFSPVVSIVVYALLSAIKSSALLISSSRTVPGKSTCSKYTIFEPAAGTVTDCTIKSSPSPYRLTSVVTSSPVPLVILPSTVKEPLSFSSNSIP